MGRALGHRGHRWAGPLLVGIAGLVVVLTTILPLGEIALELVRAGIPGLHALASSRPWWLLLRSLLVALTVTACTLVLGVPLGALFARARVPLRRILFGAHALPMLMPPFLSALGWFHLLGRRGMLGSETSSSALFSVIGLVTILALTFTPVVTSLTVLGVLAVDPSLEEAARLVARPIRVVTRVLLPAARPAVLLAALVVFVLAFSELGVPMFLRQEVYPATVFARLGGIDYAPGEAAALALPVVPLALALLFVERRTVGQRAFTVLGLRERDRAPLALGRLGVLAALACILAASLSLLPLASLAVRAARGGGFSIVWSWMGSAPVNSLLIAGCAAAVITAVSVVLGHSLAREFRGARFAEGVALLGFFLPSAVLGVGLIAIWNRAPTQFLYGSIASVVLGFVARYNVIGMRVFAAGVAQSSPSYEDAARIGGAGYLRRLLRIVLPMHRRAAVATWLVALVFSLRDLETAVLFYPPGGEPLTVRIFTLEANGPEAAVAALAIVHTGITLLVLLTGSSLLRVGGRA